AFSASGFGSPSPRSGGRAAAIGKQRRRPVAGACPSPHPAGNLGGALGIRISSMNLQAVSQRIKTLQIWISTR
ncbi:unnamed protein product, partial [Gulo gulo]